MDKVRIMVVEDEAIVAHDMAGQLTDIGYDVVGIAHSGEGAIEKAAALLPDLVLMDIVLAGAMNGIQTAERIKAIRDIPIVYLTAYSDDDTLGRAKNTNPAGYVLKPVEMKQLHIAIEMALHKPVMELTLQKNHCRIYESMKGMIRAIAETVELRGPFAPGHHGRVADLAAAIGREMELTELQQESIALASTIYDIGTVNIPAEILQESERLDGIKQTIYRTYPGAAYDTLKKIECVWPIADIVLQHRECFDGSGFPRGLRGDSIMIEARVLAVAIGFEELTTHRNYRAALPIDGALEQIAAESGRRYDAGVVAACLRLFREKGYKKG